MKKIRLLMITVVAAKRLFPEAVRKAVSVPEDDDLDPGDLEWFIDSDGHLWSNDAYEDHGWTYFRLTGRSREVGIDRVERL